MTTTLVRTLGVLIVDDLSTCRMLIRHMLERSGDFACYEASSATAALQEIERCPIELVICDLAMPEVGGEWVLQALRRRIPRLPVVLLTREGRSAPAWDDSVRLAKPFSPEELSDAISRALERAR